ncbi:hypothetical protein ACIOD2_20660 [Amycolatopsis sp. NPDC088138]|uniref:alginate O-acetyltransferase AlgX-related protein n=1 Tax=Amycolatopsis sp. NPDC088138 TaxID=3363938 RepID=UPI0037F185F8
MTQETPQVPRSPLPPVHEAFLPREHALHRPRHGRRQAVALVCAAVFFGTPVLASVAGVHPGQFENRALTSFPGLGQGWSFFPQLGQWATDHLAFREQAVHAGDGISRGLFGEAPPLDGQRPQDQQGPIPAQPPAPAPLVNYPKVLEGKNGWMYLGDEIASHCNLKQPLAQTMAELDRLRDGVRASGRQFVVVVAPDKTTIAPEYLPSNYVGKDCRERTAAEFWQRVDADNSILDLRSGLEAQGRAVGAPVYGPQDAHWSDEGGMLMARSLAESMSPGSTASWVIKPSDPWQMPADLPPLIGHTGTTSGRHYEVLTDGKRDQTREVLSDLKAPLKLTSASGTGTYQGKVALLGDSFTYRALPYLAATFGNMTAQHHSALLTDTGSTVGDMFADNRVVAIEVVERTLASGTFGLLAPQVVDNILAKLAARPIR